MEGNLTVPNQFDYQEVGDSSELEVKRREDLTEGITNYNKKVGYQNQE